MKTITRLTLVCFCLASSVTSHAQNTFPSTGNVGIGTANPPTKLYVAGDFQINDSDWGTTFSVKDGNFDAYANMVISMISENGTLIGSYSDISFYTGFPANGNGWGGASGWWPAEVRRMTITYAGNVGIGTSIPAQKLEIGGNGGVGFSGAGLNPNDKKLYSPSDGVLEWMTHNAAGEHAFAVSHQGNKRVYLNTSGNSYLMGGNVGIGTTSPTEKLSVKGKIRAQEVIVETTGWSDHVFADSYKLQSLSEVEQHIKTEKHLPGVPSAQEVAEKGVSVGDMQAILLAKIEELTLHQIAQEKRLDAATSKIDSQAAKIAALETENAQLKK